MVLKEFRGLQALQVSLEPQARPDPKAHREFRALLVSLGLQEQLDPPALREPKEFRVPLV